MGGLLGTVVFGWGLVGFGGLASHGFVGRGVRRGLGAGLFAGGTG